MRGWGGARNSALRPRPHLTLKQCEDMMAAADHAERIGMAFNRHWSVHYQSAGIAEADATRFIGRLLKLTREYARRHGGGFAAVWSRENGDGKGGHVHILMHLPADLSLSGRTAKWVRLAGGVCIAGVSYIRSVAGRLIAADNGGEHYAVNVGIVREYLLKGAAGEVRAALGLERFPGEQGEVIGKRCGWTQNIGQGARARGGSDA
jgi:hypothetical protein